MTIDQSRHVECGLFFCGNLQKVGKNLDQRKPIIALDFQDVDALVDFLNMFDESLNVKIGMELYYSTGIEMIQQLKDRGHDIFLDLKLHDIPNTVKWAMKSLAKQGVAMVNVHALGGSDMMRAAKEGLQKGTPDGKKPPILLAVTQLTSTTTQQMQDEQNIEGNIEDNVSHLARLTQTAGLDGVVCSPLESPQLKQNLGQDFLTVTPGIRLHKGGDDQKRIATPYEAALYGSDYIVVGRPITQADNPVTAYKMIRDQWQQGLQERGK